MEYVTLNNILECPAVGIGTFMLSPADAENSIFAVSTYNTDYILVKIF